MEQEHAAARARERAAIAEQDRLAELRMSEATSDYRLPSRQRPPIEHVVLTERERIAARQHREEVEAQERVQREQLEKPIRELEAKINQTARQTAALERRVLTDPATPDPDFWHDPKLVGLHLTVEGATQWNYAMLKGFADSHPEFVVSDHNLQILMATSANIPS
ncbi:hypothetical protein [Terriglobus roseus]|uniref:hypothetical protein n=1 Tax=Terriglobus roseus TaxID=392734 RepID=UPI0012EADD3D|nr:hypothetical protein [Terriglobus roseus]